jgi:dCMP deaminase
MDKLTINPNRIEIDEAYLSMAEVWARRSKANRLQVGALIVKNGRIISDGYNGMPSGAEGDDDVCEEYYACHDYNVDAEPVIRTKQEVLHAEANAILKLAADGNGGGSEGATLYCTYSPCPECAKLIVQAKIARVVYRNHYRLPEGIERLEKRGVKCEQLIK